MPPAVKVLLLTLAIVDDIGAIAVIAVFYSDGLRPSLLLAAAAIAGLVALMHRAHICYPPVVVLSALALWMVVYESGVHATIAGEGRRSRRGRRASGPARRSDRTRTGAAMDTPTKPLSMEASSQGR